MGPWTSHPLPGTPSVTLHPLVQERWAPQPTTARQVPAAISLSVPRLLEGWAHSSKGWTHFGGAWTCLGCPLCTPSWGQGHLGGRGGAGQEAGKEDAQKKKRVREAD